MVDEQIVDSDIPILQEDAPPLILQPDESVVVSSPDARVIGPIVEQPPKGVGDTYNPYSKISIYDRSFWDLWIQKVFRNFSSMKCQFLWAFFWTVIYGMFIGEDINGTHYISPTLGLGFLSGGFITLITARLAVKTSLFESPTDPLDSDS